MNFFALSGLLAFAASLVFSVFSFLKGKKHLNKIWSLFCWCVATWGYGAYKFATAQNTDEVFSWLRFGHIGVILMPALFLHFIFEFFEIKRLKPLILFYSLSAFFLIINALDWVGLSHLFIAHLRFVFNSFYVDSPPGPLYSFFLLFFFGGTIYAHYCAIRQYQVCDKFKQLQMKYFLAATIIGFGGGGTSFFMVYGIDIYPFLHITVPLYPIIMTYAIVNYQLMDIEVIIRRTAVFAGLFTFVYGVFTLVTLLGQSFFRGILGLNESASLMPTVLIVTFALKPLDNFLTNVTEKFLFQKKYDYRQLLRTFTNEILTVLDLQKLMDQTIVGLIKIIKLESACVLMFDKTSKGYKVMASSGVKKDSTFEESDALISYLKATHHAILRDKAADKIDGASKLKEDFKSLNARLCLPIILHDNLIGVLCLGMKKSGEDYTQEDVDILTTLARAEAIAISNAQLFDELSKTQAEAAQREKMAVIGTLAAGINHEICNPLGIVRGQCEMFLLNLRDGFYKDKSADELLQISADVMNKVIKETDRATGITKKLSGFAKPSKRTELEEVYVDKEVDEVIGLVGHDLKLSNIEFQKDVPQDFPAILADKKQIQEVLFNIIRNAAQAMDKKEGRIILSGYSHNGSAIVRISDNGSGIPQDKIDQIFNPFYTTKAPGKGTGLGLFIVKQVVERNKGTIAVESEQGVGTTFILTFPATAKLVAA